MRSYQLPRFTAATILLLVLSGCDDKAIIAQNQEIYRCHNQTVEAGSSLEDRRAIFERKIELKKGCSNWEATNDYIDSSHFTVDGFPAGFYPQGIESTPEDNSLGGSRLNVPIIRKSYEESFDKNYADYRATLSAEVPATCIGQSFYGCVKKISQSLLVSTSITGDYIYRPSVWRDIVIPTSGASITVQDPNGGRGLDSAVSLRLLSKSAALTVDSIILTFGPFQGATIERKSARDMADSNLYEIFSSLSDSCKSQTKEQFYDSIEQLMAIRHVEKTHFEANGYSASVDSKASSVSSKKICDMQVKVKRNSGAYADWHGSGDGTQLKLEIKR